jgi:hypothetical protein
VRFLAFRSSAPVQKYIAPSSQIPSSGVTCGRPSVRTDDSQYNSASSSNFRPCVHSVGAAPSLLNPAKVVVGSRSITRFLLPPEHSCCSVLDQRGRVVRHDGSVSLHFAVLASTSPATRADLHRQAAIRARRRRILREASRERKERAGNRIWRAGEFDPLFPTPLLKAPRGGEEVAAAVVELGRRPVERMGPEHGADEGAQCGAAACPIPVRPPRPLGREVGRGSRARGSAAPGARHSGVLGRLHSHWRGAPPPRLHRKVSVHVSGPPDLDARGTHCGGVGLPLYGQRLTLSEGPRTGQDGTEPTRTEPTFELASASAGGRSPRWESNPRPTPYQGVALPLSYLGPWRPNGTNRVGGALRGRARRGSDTIGLDLAPLGFFFVEAKARGNGEGWLRDHHPAVSRLQGAQLHNGQEQAERPRPPRAQEVLQSLPFPYPASRDQVTDPRAGRVRRAHRGVAQLVRASVSKTEGREFESCRPCHGTPGGRRDAAPARRN